MRHARRSIRHVAAAALADPRTLGPRRPEGREPVPGRGLSSCAAPGRAARPRVPCRRRAFGGAEQCRRRQRQLRLNAQTEESGDMCDGRHRPTKVTARRCRTPLRRGLMLTTEPSITSTSRKARSPCRAHGHGAWAAAGLHGGMGGGRQWSVRGRGAAPAALIVTRSGRQWSYRTSIAAGVDGLRGSRLRTPHAGVIRKRLAHDPYGSDLIGSITQPGTSSNSRPSHGRALWTHVLPTHPLSERSDVPSTRSAAKPCSPKSWASRQPSSANGLPARRKYRIRST